MYSSTRLEAVLLSFQTSIHNFQQKSPFRTRNMAYLLGPSAFFPTASTSCSRLQEFKSGKRIESDKQLLQVISQTSEIKMIPVGAFPWQSYNEQTPTSDDSDTLAMEGLYEQLNITRDASHYLWYLTDVNIAPDEGFRRNGQSPFLTIMSAGPYLAGFH
ncbi:hypothetical protein RJ639_015298 [Escallonia herrerae]|uniref:Uncharacterized protein n=1 Tax=Escallonia herrerae TaxID=1293975 RepID=A0AA89ANH4_9ASTE|nr:hypothetical protein RJ639_015298 [Escallonia herrerae]